MHQLKALLQRTRGHHGWGVPMSNYTWFRVGGPALVLFFPADEEDLSFFLREYDGPVFILGAGSNILVRDGGISQVVIKLGKGFRQFMTRGLEVTAGAGLLDRVMAQKCQSLGIGGFEFFYTIPGTLGGALRMNAGCYGGETRENLLQVRVMDLRGNIHTLDSHDLQCDYRHCGLPQGWIFLSGRWKGTAQDPHDIAVRMQQGELQRTSSQPQNTPTGGSTFRNPPGHQAWALIQEAGYRGRRLGHAQISEKHCNFLLNLGGATAAHLEDLGEEARQAVWDKTAIRLSWEIIRLGLRYPENLPPV